MACSCLSVGAGGLRFGIVLAPVEWWQGSPWRNDIHFLRRASDENQEKGGRYMSLDEVFGFKLRFRRRDDDKGLNPQRQVYYRRDYGAGVTAFVTPLDGEDAPRDEAFRLTFRDENKDVLMVKDCTSPMGGEFFLNNALEMTKNVRK